MAAEAEGHHNGTKGVSPCEARRSLIQYNRHNAVPPQTASRLTMKNRHIVKQVYELVSDLAGTLPYLQFEVYTCNEPPALIRDLYLVGRVTAGVPIGGYAIRAGGLVAEYEELLPVVFGFFRRAWQGDTARYYPADIKALYELHEAGEEVWWQVV